MQALYCVKSDFVFDGHIIYPRQSMLIVKCQSIFNPRKPQRVFQTKQIQLNVIDAMQIQFNLHTSLIKYQFSGGKLFH